MKIRLNRKLGLTLLLLSALLAFGWVVATQGPLAPIRVTVTELQSGSLSSAVFGIGTVEARRRYALGPTLPARVAQVKVDEGEAVAAGQVVAVMDSIDLVDRLESARLAAERSDQAVRSAEALHAETDSRVRLAQSNLTRYQGLRAQGMVSAEHLESRQHEAAAAKAAQLAAQAALEAARRDQARARSDMAGLRKQLEQMTLRSPVDGIVIARHVEPGATVVAGAPVIELIDPGSLWVEARVNQRLAGQLREGQPAEIVLRSQPGVPLPGRVARVDWLSDAVTEERIMHLVFDTPPSRISIGELVEITVRITEHPDVRWLPTAAIQHHGQVSGVWIIGADGLAFQPVTTEITSLDGRTEIRNGVAPGVAVVVYAEKALSPGAKIRVVPALDGGAR